MGKKVKSVSRLLPPSIQVGVHSFVRIMFPANHLQRRSLTVLALFDDTYNIPFVSRSDFLQRVLGGLNTSPQQQENQRSAASMVAFISTSQMRMGLPPACYWPVDFYPLSTAKGHRSRT